MKTSCSTMVENRLTEQEIRVQSSPKSGFLLLVLLPETNGLLQIIIGAICAFPEQNHVIAFRDPKKCYISKMTPVAQW